MPELSRIAPELSVSDLKLALEWYEQKLGFHVAMEMPDAQYAIVERDAVAIHLFQSAAGQSVALHIFVNDLDGLQAELDRRGTSISQRISLKPWGNRDFRVNDPSGNELKFTEPLRS
jgi:uncharacterized glyoxalase superfamily protein PhnB